MLPTSIVILNCKKKSLKIKFIERIQCKFILISNFLFTQPISRCLSSTLPDSWLLPLDPIMNLQSTVLLLLTFSLAASIKGEKVKEKGDNKWCQCCSGKTAHSITRSESFTVKPQNICIMIKLFMNVWGRSDLCIHLSLYHKPTVILAKLHLIHRQIIQYWMLSSYLTLLLHYFRIVRIGMQKPGLSRYIRGARCLS